MKCKELEQLNPEATLIIDYEKLCHIIETQELTQERFSQMVGHNRAWFANTKNRKANIAVGKVIQMALILRCDAEDFVITPDKKEPASTEEYTDITDVEPSEFEVDVMDALKEIKSQLSTQKEILMYLFNEKQQKENGKPEAEEKDELEIACKTLKTMLQDRVGIKMTDYMQTVKRAGVSNEKVADAAIAKVGYNKKTTGYGNNKTIWIYKTVEI